MSTVLHPAIQDRRIGQSAYRFLPATVGREMLQWLMQSAYLPLCLYRWMIEASLYCCGTGQGHITQVLVKSHQWHQDQLGRHNWVYCWSVLLLCKKCRAVYRKERCFTTWTRPRECFNAFILWVSAASCISQALLFCQVSFVEQRCAWITCLQHNLSLIQNLRGMYVVKKLHDSWMIYVKPILVLSMHKAQ